MSIICIIAAFLAGVIFGGLVLVVVLLLIAVAHPAWDNGDKNDSERN